MSDGEPLYNTGTGTRGLGTSNANVPPGTPAGGGDIFQQSANAYKGGVQGLQFAANPNAMSSTMNQFINPFQEQVLSRAMQRSQQSQSEGLNMVRGQAAQAGAYGGARQGLVEAELMDRYNQNDMDMVSRMLQNGFTTSAGLAGQSVAQSANASQGLIGASQTGYGLGQSALQTQMQTGQQQQQMNQNILNTADGQFQGYVNYPNSSLATALAGLQGNPLGAQTTQNQTYKPGFFDYLSLGANTYAAGMGPGGK